MRMLVMESGSLHTDSIRPSSVGMSGVAKVDSLRKVHGVAGGAIKASYQLYSHFRAKKGMEVHSFADFSPFGVRQEFTDSRGALSMDYDFILMNSLRDVMLVDGYVKTHGTTRTIYTDRGNALVNYSLPSAMSKLSPKAIAMGHLLRSMRKWLGVYVAITAEQRTAAGKFFGPNTRLAYIPIAPDGSFRRLGRARRFAGAVYVGRLDERQKRVSFLIAGIARLVKEHPSLAGSELVRVYGSGPDEQNYRRLARAYGVSRCISFRGFASGQKLVSAYNDAGFLVSTSDWESPGRVFLEAMACGTPVLLNDRVNCDMPPGGRLIKDGVNGMVYRHGDADSFISKFYQMYSKPGLLRRLSANAYRSSRVFSLKGTMERYDRLVLG